MTDFLRLILEIFQYIFPLRKVEQWEQGVVYVFGRYWKTVAPGVYPIVPWFMEVREVSVVPGVLVLPLQTITLRDGRALTFSASVGYQVLDAERAMNSVERYEETASELASGLLAERFADVDPARFDPARGRRDRLLAELAEELNEATRIFGLEISRVMLANFAMGVRTYRLLTANGSG